uniref:Uncharacterized protein n=1 Tax=Rhizophora mucronata TaxID=61149 RepID=A0A2P2LBM2_RHIMU
MVKLVFSLDPHKIHHAILSSLAAIWHKVYSKWVKPNAAAGQKARHFSHAVADVILMLGGLAEF